MKDLTAQDILAADDMNRQCIQVPEWGGQVHVRTVSMRKKDWIEGQQIELKEKGLSTYENLRARWIAAAACDAEGKSVFTYEQAEALGDKSTVAADRLFGTILKLNAATKADVEELLGNSSGGQTANSNSN